MTLYLEFNGRKRMNASFPIVTALSRISSQTVKTQKH